VGEVSVAPRPENGWHAGRGELSSRPSSRRGGRRGRGRADLREGHL